MTFFMAEPKEPKSQAWNLYLEAAIQQATLWLFVAVYFLHGSQKK